MDSNNQEKIISNILDEDKYSLVAQKFMENGINTHRNICQDEMDLTKNENRRNKRLKLSLSPTNQCSHKFLQLVRFDINFEEKLKDFEEYCKERTCLANVLEDIINSVGDENVIDGIDCF